MSWLGSEFLPDHQAVRTAGSFRTRQDCRQFLNRSGQTSDRNPSPYPSRFPSTKFLPRALPNSIPDYTVLGNFYISSTQIASLEPDHLAPGRTSLANDTGKLAQLSPSGSWPELPEPSESCAQILEPSKSWTELPELSGIWAQRPEPSGSWTSFTSPRVAELSFPSPQEAGLTTFHSVF